METIEELKQKRADIDKEINKHVRAKEKRMLKEAQKFVGKCYKFYNSMSGGEKFITYLKVKNIKSVWIQGDNLMVNIEGVVVNDHKDIYSIEKEITYLSMWMDNPISNKEFERIYAKVLAKLK